MLELRDKMRKAFTQAVLILVIGVIAALCANAVRPGGLALCQLKEAGLVVKAPRVYTADECWQLLSSGKAVFLDAREADLYRMGHLPGALHMPKDRVTQNLQKLKGLERGYKVLITYCDGKDCGKARELEVELERVGITSLGIFEDGWQGWMDKGYPIDEGGG
ncbi:MAG TPA: rhodanese-like domain-containing protein [Desulfomonilia bacterium]|nr:rhodanese-like domain-containing protein [Desulfomonilia bacterium]